ncbi:MAG: hypothetical protein ACQEP8_03190 [Chlamydiota bacterium]
MSVSRCQKKQIVEKSEYSDKDKLSYLQQRAADHLNYSEAYKVEHWVETLEEMPDRRSKKIQAARSKLAINHLSSALECVAQEVGEAWDIL